LCKWRAVGFSWGAWRRPWLKCAVFAIFLISFAFTSFAVFFCKKEGKNSSLSISFDVANAGNKVSAKVAVFERQVYAIELQYPIKEKSRLDQERVRRLVGVSMQNEGRVWSEPGAPLLIRVLVEEIGNGREEIKVDRQISRPRLSSWGALR
jgi:hypothetical protein